MAYLRFVRISCVALTAFLPVLCAAAIGQEPSGERSSTAPVEGSEGSRAGMLREHVERTSEEQELDEIQALLRKLREQEQGPRWTLADVTKMSDLVVLAHCKATRRLDVDKVEDPDVKKLAESYAEEVLELHVATMEVATVLKGTNTEIETIELVYPLPREDTSIFTNVDIVHLSTRMRVPLQVQVVIEGEVRSTGRGGMYHEITPLYMLLLKKCGETMYEPASTTKWPSKSIRRVLE